MTPPSDDQPTVTERQAILRERAAFQHGARHGMEFKTDDFADAAQSFFPLTPILKPRVVRDPHSDYEWCMEAGTAVWRLSPRKMGTAFQLEWHAPGGHVGEVCIMTPERIQLLANLLAFPTEPESD